MSTTTFPTAILREDGRTSALLILVDEETVDLYGAKHVQDVIQSHSWVAEQGLPIIIAWNLDDDPKIYGQSDWVDWLSSQGLDEIPWNYELTLDWSEYDQDDEDYDEDDEDYDEDDEDYDEDDEDYDEDD